MIYLVVQGKIKEGAEDIYTEYLKGVAPLMQECGVEIVAVGSGLESDLGTKFHSHNAIMKVADKETLEKFLSDERYLEIKKKYRDVAYEYLDLSFFEGRPPRKMD